MWKPINRDRQGAPCPGRISRLLVMMPVLLAGCTWADPSGAPSSTRLTALPLRADAGQIFVPGEESVYGVSWGGVLPVGRVTFRYDEVETQEGPFLLYEAITEPLLPLEAFLKSAGTIRTLAHPETFLPVTTFWVTANKKPHSRTTVFDQEKGTAITGKWTSTFTQTAKVTGKPMLDPVGVIFAGRIIDFPEDGTELHGLVIEGIQRQLLTIRQLDKEELIFEGKRVPCTKVSLRTDRLDEKGQLIGEEPWNDLVAWIAENPNRTIMRIAGKVRFGSIAMKLARYTVPERP